MFAAGFYGASSGQVAASATSGQRREASIESLVDSMITDLRRLRGLHSDLYPINHRRLWKLIPEHFPVDPMQAGIRLHADIISALVFSLAVVA